MRNFLKNGYLLCVYLFILLFIYAAVSKLTDFQNFKIQLAQSPLLTAFASFIAYAVIGMEVLIAVLLCFSITRKTGLYLFLGLMSAFSVYIYLILNHSPFVPCSCGGVLEKMGWDEHLAFNLLICMLALACCLYADTGRSLNRRLLLSGFVICSNAIVVFGLYQESEYLLRNENPFVRRFVPHVVDNAKYLNLNADSYYIAGLTEDTLYLGNHTAPLSIKAVAMNLSSKEHSISLDETRRTFKSLSVEVYGHFFYVSDGTVPVIYKGTVNNWKARKFMTEKIYFSLLRPVSPNEFLFRSQRAFNGEHILGKLHTVNTRFELYDHVLQKQLDGIFDTDGQLITDPVTNQGIYTYYYRNEYKVYQPGKNDFSSGKTIDTTGTAQLHLAQLPNGTRKMDTPPYKVNSQTYAFNGFLYIHSEQMGKNEPKRIWNQAIIVDVYDYNLNQYRYSFYAYDYEKHKTRQFALNTHYFFGLAGDVLIRFERITK